MKIAIVNDLPMAVEAIRRTLYADRSHTICWTAANGVEAVERCAVDPPDLLLMDMVMPVMDGVEATRRIMAASPCKILIVTADVSLNSAKVFEAMGAGAVDVVMTPTVNQSSSAPHDLIKKIDMIARVAGFKVTKRNTSTITRPEKSPLTRNPVFLVAIGCSTGGPQASQCLLSTFPADFPAAFVVIQHIDEQFAQGLVKSMAQHVNLSVKMLHENNQLEPGVVLIPSAKEHVILKANGRLGYQARSTGDFYLPSADIFFKSVAKNWNGNAIGVLLTGMGRDGAEGLLALHERGFTTIAQNKETCVVYGMPKAAIELNAADKILPLSDIGPAIASLAMLGEKKHAGV